MTNIIFEVCCGSYEDVINATLGGANRIELNSALYLGGLTPNLAEFKLSKNYTNLPIIVMIRPRGAGFFYNEYEFKTMYEEAKLLIENGADGIAFGILNQDFTIDIERCKSLIKLAHDNNREAVFHRAFDLLNDQEEGIKQLISLGVDRILTSFGANTAPEASNKFIDYHKKYGSSIEILAGCGFNSSNITKFIKETNINQIHASCKKYIEDPTTSNNDVSYSYSINKDSYEASSLIEIKKITSIIKAI